MSGQQPANWRTECAEQVAAAEVRVTERLDTEFAAITRTTIAVVQRIEALEKQNGLYFCWILLLALPHLACGVMVLWEVTR